MTAPSACRGECGTDHPTPAEQVTDVTEVNLRGMVPEVEGPDWYVPLVATNGSRVRIYADVMDVLGNAWLEGRIADPDRCDWYGGCSHYVDAGDRLCLTHTPSTGRS